MNKIKKLKYPIWFNIVYFVLTILIPLTLVIIEGFKAPNDPRGTTFKISFMFFVTAILSWYFIKHFILNKTITKLTAKQVALEHDYSIDVGNPKKIKELWFRNELKLTLYNMISVLLHGGLMVIIMLGVASSLMKIKGLVFIIASLYIISYTIKFMLLIVIRGDEYEDENDNTTEG